MGNMNKFHKKEILLQPPGEPREQHLRSDVQQKKVRATENFIKDEMTGRVYIYWRIFEANFIWLLSSKNFSFGNFKTS